jgi:hypothetical protein
VKIVSIVSAIVFIVMACVDLYLWDMRSAQYCCLMAMMWCIYLKLLYMEGK